ncbi:CBS domain-containing protein [Gilvimarinus xylanilyticus]|uniref:CBS domain-containing protein n=1 Tax=Gilvimarinus xylanilyticus TaxID=2944139 RepID=A0A9X2HYJ1_9GAMM|nr:CBS domain-containing protein [Gilvimarinus xylanilyticus]MCP8900783.1 CBS domain-containing protein [Gilvimarinus xylanilyticus]
MKPVPSIPVCRLNHKLLLSNIETPQLTLSSPADKVFIDFDTHQPMVIDQDVSVEDAGYLMRITHSKVKLVVGRKNELLGIISVRDIESVKVLATASAMGVARADLTVKDIMTPTVRLQGITRKTMERSRISDLVEVLEFEGASYLLVLDDSEQICGLISADEISHRLDRYLDIEPVAHSFNDVFSALKVSNH